MSELDDLTKLPSDFDGCVRLFPLPSLVLMPHAMQPLHFYEPRYCELLADALKTDELITMSTYKQPGSQGGSEGKPPAKWNPTASQAGWESSLGSEAADAEALQSGDDIPEIHSTVCICKIVSHVPLDGDRSNVLLVGIKRATITSEVDAGRCYRMATVQPLHDMYPPAGAPGRIQLREQLLHTFGKVIPGTDSVQQSLQELITSSMGLGPITDIISHTLPLPIAAKLSLLKQPDVDQRARDLIAAIIQLATPAASPWQLALAASQKSPEKLPFPPSFSLN
ncbi:Lon protease [Stieleria bergensis]|uniref:Lon protease n=1 Tax=Stieleria bergensis TaxID=2528025 RepID=A0A517SY93_9BACT|nr:Lon protease [Planctomycetes bacterium SV_7m_r]